MLQIEVAGTVIQMEDNEAALIVYCPPEWQGVLLEIFNIVESKDPCAIFHHYAAVVGRMRDGEKVYAAIFPRIYFIPDYWLQYNVRKHTALARVETWNKKLLTLGYEEVTLYAGNVTEIDWSDKKE